MGPRDGRWSVLRQLWPSSCIGSVEPAVRTHSFRAGRFPDPCTDPHVSFSLRSESEVEQIRHLLDPLGTNLGTSDVTARRGRNRGGASSLLP